MSAFFMVADTTGRQGALSTAKIEPAMKALPNSTNAPSRFRDGHRIAPTPHHRPSQERSKPAQKQRSPDKSLKPRETMVGRDEARPLCRYFIVRLASREEPP
ncbi:mlr1434 [Mesorhizobium japonicum MAFF 303099]|uniref:Mlr1434 protein n=1 Tax=Mesorhizobium japonicum (strain LMG 29417 / CECT 9101 / MAFF 303099) TaxID=266835 RepID=Q98KK5_RHILO|nr:mlr1434 [Mesorhizobium japonicum MAFF 303099]